MMRVLAEGRALRRGVRRDTKASASPGGCPASAIFSSIGCPWVLIQRVIRFESLLLGRHAAVRLNVKVPCSTSFHSSEK
jgi:hypothetical protein